MNNRNNALAKTAKVVIGTVSVAICATLMLTQALHAAPQAKYHAEIRWIGDGMPPGTDRMVGTNLPLIVTSQLGGRVPTPPVRVHVVISPEPPAIPNIQWSATSDVLSILDRVDSSRSFFGSLPPGFAQVERRSRGITAIQAMVGPPVNQILTLPALVYDPVFVGCSFGQVPGVRFAPDGTAQRAPSIEESDIYQTGPANGPNTDLFNGCTGAFIAGQEAPFIMHFPGGATIVNDTQYFPKVRSPDWKSDFTEWTRANAGALIFRTRDGRFVKVKPFGVTGVGISGPFEISDRRGVFADSIAYGSLHSSAKMLFTRPQNSPRFSARINYVDFAPGFIGPLHSLIVTQPYPERTSFVPANGSVAHVLVSPAPYAPLLVHWTMIGMAARIERASQNFVHITAADAGTSTLYAHVAAPVSAKVQIAVRTYKSIVFGCGSRMHAVAFDADGNARPVASTQEADLYGSFNPSNVDCGGSGGPAMYFPSGAVLFPNGDDPARRPPQDSPRGKQFPDVTSAMWEPRLFKLDIDAWRRLAAPCDVPEFPGVVRIDQRCTKMPSSILLLKTRSGLFVKILIQNANGTATMAGPYAVMK